jgi:ATP-dependent Clp protease ATP-binding subunit ClpB
VLTSNLGTQALSQLPDGADAGGARDVMDAVRAHFRPEFLNRLDDMIVFDRLTRETWTGSSTIQLGGWRSGWRSARSRWSSTRREAWLADEGYDPVFGARPLKRVIQRRCRIRWPR